EAKKVLGECTDWTLGMVQRQLERAVAYFGAATALTAIDVARVQDWSTWLRKQFKGRRGRATLSDGSVRHSLNALSNLYRRAQADVHFGRKTVTFREHAWRRLKTDTSRRVVPLWPQLEEILRAYLAGPHAPEGELLFPSLHRRVRGHEDETMLGDLRGALDAVAEKAGW